MFYLYPLRAILFEVIAQYMFQHLSHRIYIEIRVGIGMPFIGNIVWVIT